MSRHLVAIAPCLWVGAAWAQGTGDPAVETRQSADSLLPVEWNLRAGVGWARLSDIAETQTPGGSVESVAGTFAWGIDAAVYPWSGLLLHAAFNHSVTNIDTPEVITPQAQVSWTRLRLDAGWRFAFDGPLRTVSASAGYGREGWNTPRQRPTQMSPAWTHDELRLAGLAEARFVGDSLIVAAGLELIPVMGVSAAYESHGASAGGLGIDVKARADYDLGAVFGRFGNLWLGGQVGWGSRWIGYHGEGSRLASDGVTAVREVDQNFQRLELLASLTWHFPRSIAGGERGAERVGSQIKIKSRVLFTSGSADLDMTRSRSALRAVSRFLEENEDVERVQVRGHTDGSGDSARNAALSQQRAEAVVSALVALGIEPDRLRAQGAGDSEPIASNDAESGRAKNRRVEFHILSE